MQLEYKELDNGIRLIELTGTLDIIGTGVSSARARSRPNLQAIVPGIKSAWLWIYPVWTSLPLSAFDS